MSLCLETSGIRTFRYPLPPGPALPDQILAADTSYGNTAHSMALVTSTVGEGGMWCA